MSTHIFRLKVQKRSLNNVATTVPLPNLQSLSPKTPRFQRCLASSRLAVSRHLHGSNPWEAPKHRKRPKRLSSSMGGCAPYSSTRGMLTSSIKITTLVSVGFNHRWTIQRSLPPDTMLVLLVDLHVFKGRFTGYWILIGGIGLVWDLLSWNIFHYLSPFWHLDRFSTTFHPYKGVRLTHMTHDLRGLLVALRVPAVLFTGAPKRVFLFLSNLLSMLICVSWPRWLWNWLYPQVVANLGKMMRLTSGWNGYPVRWKPCYMLSIRSAQVKWDQNGIVTSSLLSKTHRLWFGHWKSCRPHASTQTGYVKPPKTILEDADPMKPPNSTQVTRQTTMIDLTLFVHKGIK